MRSPRTGKLARDNASSGSIPADEAFTSAARVFRSARLVRVVRKSKDELATADAAGRVLLVERQHKMRRASSRSRLWLNSTGLSALIHVCGQRRVESASEHFLLTSCAEADRGVACRESP
jgi:hypothetical protein